MMAGCGGGTAPRGIVAGDWFEAALRPSPSQPPEDLFPLGRIHEYVGDGHGGTKPLPDFVHLKPQVSTQSLAPRLWIRRVSRAGEITARHINWYEVEPINVESVLVATLQPTNSGDADLYIMEGPSADYSDGLDCIQYSSRLPNGGQDDAVRGNGFAPDWAAWLQQPSGGKPAAMIAVWGEEHDTTDKRTYRIEVDRVRTLVVDGATQLGNVARGQSDWFRFQVWGSESSPASYRVAVKAISNDPDMYVYRSGSVGFIGESAEPGGGTVEFQSTSWAYVYVRVYGYGNGPNRYRIRVVQQ